MQRNATNTRLSSLLGKRLALALASTAALTGCPKDGGGEDGGSGDEVPQRDEWRVAGDFFFPYIVDDAVQITSVQIGGEEFQENFANRGDVIVEFDGVEEHILIELRRFTFANSLAEAEETDFPALQLWAYNPSSDQPKAPADMDPALNCAVGFDEGGWKDGCRIRVYYDGIEQLQRSGADIRVTLPPSYRNTIRVITEDNVGDADYVNRGNVCINDFAGTADVSIEAGLAYVTVAEDTRPIPTCTGDFEAQCEMWPCATDEAACDGSEAWSPNCPCIAQGFNFAQTQVRSRAPRAADAVVDVPASLWTSITARNEQTGQDTTMPGTFCTATVDVAGYEIYEGVGNDFVWTTRGVLNQPSDAAIEGAGYQISLSSAACQPVASTENPADFVGKGNGTEQESTLRGNLNVCDGCLREMACEDILPGG